MRKSIKITLWIIIILIIIGIGYYLWKIFNVGENLKNLTDSNNAPAVVQQPTVAKKKLTNLTENPIFDYWVNKTSNSIYYIQPAGEVVRITDVVKITNSQTLNKLNRVIASPDGNYAIAKFNYPNSTSFSLFNTETNSWQPLPPNVISAAWSPDSKQILILDDKALKILDIKDFKTKNIISMSQEELNLDWTSASTVVLSFPSSDQLPSSAWSLSLKDKSIVPLATNEYGLVINWSKDGQYGIKFNNVIDYQAGKKPLTSLIKSDGQTLVNLSFNTIPSKCLILEKNIYCAVPKNINDGVILLDDYYKRSVYFDDSIHLLDLSDGSSKSLWQESSNIDADHLEIFNNQLLFKNRLDDKLYSLELGN